MNGPALYRDREYAEQQLWGVADSGPKWTTAEFIQHFYLGAGRPVTLAEMGYMEGVVKHYFYNIVVSGKNTYDRVNSQIIAKAREQNRDGSFSYTFRNSYTELGKYFWIFGSGTIEGRFDGTVSRDGDMLLVKGDIRYRYSDTFTDPLSIRESITTGTSEPMEAWKVGVYFSDFAGTFYDIVGTWSSRFSAEVKADARESRY